MRSHLSIKVKTGGEVKVRSCRRELEEEHHVLTESCIHQVSFAIDFLNVINLPLSNLQLFIHLNSSICQNELELPRKKQ